MIDQSFVEPSRTLAYIGDDGAMSPHLASQYKYLRFSALPYFRKIGKFAAAVNSIKAKNVSTLGGGGLAP